MMEVHKEVDASNLKCPLPILRCKKGLNELESGQILKIVATDPNAVKDFEAFCRQTGHTMIDTKTVDAVFTFLIQKKPEAA